jgi:hypothetical protein
MRERFAIAAIAVGIIAALAGRVAIEANRRGK